MDDPTASKVNIAIDREPTFLRPSPVNHYRVDNGRDEGAENKEGVRVVIVVHIDYKYL